MKDKYYLKLRVFLKEQGDTDKISDEVALLLSELHERCTWIGWCIEDDNGSAKVHMHFLLHTYKQAQTFRKLLRSMGYEGNKYYSISHSDEEWPIQYIAYMMKETNDKINEDIIYDYDMNIPEHIADEVREYDDKVKASMQELREKKKLAKRSMIERLEEYIEDFLLCESNGEYEEEVYKYKKAIIQFHIENKLLIRRFQCQAYLDTILARKDMDSQGLMRRIFGDM